MARSRSNGKDPAARRPELGESEGRPVVGTEIAVRKMGGGLDDPLAIDPEIIRVGERRVLLTEIVCIDVQHPAENRKEPADGGVKRVAIFDPVTTTFIDPASVADALHNQQEKVAAARAAAADAKKGQTTLQSQIAEALAEAHESGEHAGGLVEGCGACDEERELVDPGK